MIPRLLAAAVASVALAACGGDRAGGEDTATLWVTRDRGASVLVDVSVAAGQTAMQALDRETELETRYGGRYVQSVNGLAGSLSRGVDWFYFVNGYEGDRSASEYRLRPGDIVWFDYRPWRARMSEPIVVGAFPQPFTGGYAGRRRDAVVQYDAALRPDAIRLARTVRGTAVRCCGALDPLANVLRLERATDAKSERFVGRYRTTERTPGAPVEFTLTMRPGSADHLVGRARHRYRWLP